MSIRKTITGILLLAVIISVNSQNTKAKLSLDKNDATVIIDETIFLNLDLRGILMQEVEVRFYEEHVGLVQIVPNLVKVPPQIRDDELWQQQISILGVRPGHMEVYANSTPAGVVEDSNLFLRIIIANSNALIMISFIVGWIYFVAWSVSFYPQAYINFRRKSVVGLNFDFLALNLLGHTLYGIFNVSLYWIPYIENEYFSRYPRGLNPVALNDVFFSIHASVLTAFTVAQCFMYERGEQRVSYIARGILGIFFLVIAVTMILAIVGTFHWLDFLNSCSYIKLAITLIKYVPQAVMNYRRKSTLGWSIGNILLDFTGGTLSMLQMMLNAYNYDDWQSLFGDPTKFGLGLFSVLFDIVFIVQHYVLYRKPNSILGDANSTKNIVNDVESSDVADSEEKS